MLSIPTKQRFGNIVIPARLERAPRLGMCLPGIEKLVFLCLSRIHVASGKQRHLGSHQFLVIIFARESMTGDVHCHYDRGVANLSQL